MAINMHMEGVDVGGVGGDLGIQPQSSDRSIDPARTNTDAGPSNSMQGAENPNDLEGISKDYIHHFILSHFALLNVLIYSLLSSLLV